MIEINFSEVAKTYGAAPVLHSVSFEIKTGDRTAIIGRNGTGKTTIFKLITGAEKPDRGQITTRHGARIGYMDQIPDFSDSVRVIDVLHAAFSDLFEWQAQIQQIEKRLPNLSGSILERTIKQYGELQNRFEHLGGYAIDDQINRVCTGLKISPDFRQRRFQTLSGGEKTSVLLGQILLQQPDILLLDEPTNHLDIEAVEWLEDFLTGYPGTVLVIAHDRYFLDRMAHKIIEIEDGTAELYHGNYTYFVAEKERRAMAQFEVFKDQQRQIKAMQEAIKRFRDWGHRSDDPRMFKKAQNMERRIERMTKIDPPKRDRKTMQLDLKSASRSGKEVIKVKNLTKTFGDNIILENCNLQVHFGDRAVILGKNGSGKSTLIKLLIGYIQADAGEAEFGANVKWAYLAQEVGFAQPERTVLETFREGLSIHEGLARHILAKYLFFGEDVFKKISHLSGGERTRLWMCQLMQQDINLLILDEPTNHLDIESREMLEEALLDFSGTILFVSHDRYFINKVAQRVIELADHRLVEYFGNYDDYKSAKDKLAARIPKFCEINVVKKIRDKRDANRQKKYERQLTSLESSIDALERRLEENDMAIAEHAYDAERLAELYQEKKAIQAQIDTLMGEWLIIDAKLVSADG